MNIYVGSLHFKMSEAELKEIFEEYGEVTSAKIIIDKYSGKSKGFGFVEMPNFRGGDNNDRRGGSGGGNRRDNYR
jgi:RNA recognition motif-containing protein